MRGGSRASNGNRAGRWLLALVAFALLARALVPAGFMPDLSRLGHGVLEIVICSPDGIATVAVDETGAPASPGPGDHGPVRGDLCLFAATAALAVAALAVALFTPFRWPARLFFAIPPTRPALAGGPGPLGPRAPPLV